MRPIPTLIALALLAGATHADDGSRRMPAQVPKAYTQECASCHMAYPPSLLPAASWQRMMGGLDKHYGTDASLDAATVKELSTWLQTNAGTYKRARAEPPPPEDRMTKSRWFARKHDGIAPAVYQRASIKSAANCMACHPGAERGNFDDDNARIPK